MSKNGEDLSDDFVASILSKEASEKNIKYSELGLQAFLPKRPTANVPKPNTRFLRNIVREADSHNAALLAKEAEESKERLRILYQKERAKRRGEAVRANGVEGRGERSRAAQRPDRQIYKVGAKREAPTTRSSVRNREDRGEREKGRKRKRSQSREGRDDEKSRRHRSRSADKRNRSPDVERERRQHKKPGERKRDRSREYKRSIPDDRKKNDSNRYHRHHSYRHHNSHRSHSRSHERGTTKSTSTSTSTSTSHRLDKKDRTSDTNTKSHSSRPRSPRRRPDESDADRERRRKRRKEMEMVEESDDSSHTSADPLTIIGPAPPPTRARGRGTISGSSAMDARFSEQYDPAMDIRLDHDGEGDDWENAIEAYRDRQKWKAVGAERLRSAGFGEDFIIAWENNDTKNTAHVKWAKEGEREWDRGKVIEEGEVKVRACWAKD